MIQNNIELEQLTTIKLGGKAKYFAHCTTRSQIIKALQFAKNNNIPFFILAGGSNVVFGDKGFDGLIIKISTSGYKLRKFEKDCLLTVEAGSNWDRLVSFSIKKGLKGIECLSGIPGSVGATPIQNVGAYGQQVSETIESVEAIDCDSLQLKIFNNADCKFSYRNSVFKGKLGKYLILSVTFKLKKGVRSNLKYDQLKSFVEQKGIKNNLQNIRQAVLILRKSKSMVLSKTDPNSRSCGSFFMNPKINQKVFLKLQKEFPDLPFYREGSLYKLPAAWLIEQAGFYKGYNYKTVGLSSRHTLALISNPTSTTRDLLAFEKLIKSRVKSKFGIELIREPIVIK